jgi:hypothetical protein
VLLDVIEQDPVDDLLDGHRRHPVSTVPLLARSASLSPRTTAAAVAEFFLCSAMVSALDTFANSLACFAFMSWSMSIVKPVD